MKFMKYALMGLSLVALASSCDEQSDLITSSEYAREFAPIGLKAQVRNQTEVRLTWTPSACNAYSVSVYHLEADSVTSTFMKTFENLTNDSIPFTVTEILQGDEQYRFDVQAVDKNNGNRNSKPNSVVCKTGSEQVMKSVSDAEIEATSVTLHWSAKNAAGCILFLTPGDIEHTITAEESAAFQAEITGLTGETEYTVVFKTAEGKKRGTTTFKTAIDLGGAIAVKEGDDLKSIIEGAEEGATIAIFPGTYSSTKDVDGVEKQDIIVLSKNISIKAVRPADRPVIKNCFQINGATSVSFSQIIIDGSGDPINAQLFDFKNAETITNVTIDDCELKGGTTTKGLMYVNVAAVIEEFKINKCLVHDIPCNGGDFIDFRAGFIKTFNFTNNTVWNCATARDFFRDSNKAENGTTLVVDHNTFYNVGTDGTANYRILYIRTTGNNTTFTNNIVAGFKLTRGFSEQAKTTPATFKNNYYFDCLNLQSLAEGNTQAVKFFDTEGKTLTASPFKDAENGNFTLTDEDVAYAKVGDPRWIAE